MAATAEYKTVLELLRLGLEIYRDAHQQAVDEANAEYEAETKKLCLLVKLNGMTGLDALEAHGYKGEPTVSRFALVLEYEQLGLDRNEAIAQAAKHVELRNKREEAIANEILRTQREQQRAERERQEQLERDRERRHVQVLKKMEFDHEGEIKKMEFEHAERENDNSRKHERDMVGMAHELEKFKLQATATLSTLAFSNPEASYALVKENSILATNVPALFHKIDAVVSDKLIRRSLVGILGQSEEQLDPAPITIGQREVQQPLIIANRFSDKIQHDMLAALNDSLGGHFFIGSAFRTTYLGGGARPDQLVMARTAVLAPTTFRAAMNVAMVVIHTAAMDSPPATAFYNLNVSMLQVLTESGPGRTHVFGVLVYRTAADDIPIPAGTTSIPEVPETMGQEADELNGGYSRLVVDVYVQFQRTLLAHPSMFKLQEGYDAAQFFAEVGSPDTTYTNFERSFALQSFRSESVENTTYKCVRFLGTGADSTHVWECVEDRPGLVAEAVLPERWSESRGSFASSDGEWTGVETKLQQHADSLVLKRSKGHNSNYEKEVLMLEHLANVFGGDVGKAFPALDKYSITSERSIVLTRPVCRKLMRGRDIRRAHLSEHTLLMYLRSLGSLFVDYVTTLKNCHAQNIVHRDITLRNLMWHRSTDDGRRRGCIIDWECAEHVNPVHGMTDPSLDGIRVSFETATEFYLDSGRYRPTDDLMALVRCWKIATQPATYKAAKQWSRLTPGREQHRRTINPYWMRNWGKLETHARDEDYDSLVAYFRNPGYIEPVPAPAFLPSEVLDSGDDAEEVEEVESVHDFGRGRVPQPRRQRRDLFTALGDGSTTVTDSL